MSHVAPHHVEKTSRKNLRTLFIPPSRAEQDCVDVSEMVLKSPAQC